MPSFSFTAPIVTAEEEKKEREELEQTEYQSVLNDMTGVCCDCENDSEYSSSSFSTSDFHKELAENVSPRDKKEMLEAMQYVPHLVATESNPCHYSRSYPSAEVSYLFIILPYDIVLFVLLHLTTFLHYTRLLRDPPLNTGNIAVRYLEVLEHFYR
jgi:hypothetical protein